MKIWNRERSLFVVLQFGHGYDAVETASPAPGWASSVRFNSATAMTPWKLGPTSFDFQAAWLQFGHGYDAVETKMPADDVADKKELQFGHGYDAVETTRSEDAVRQMRKASIRPRL